MNISFEHIPLILRSSLKRVVYLILDGVIDCEGRIVDGDVNFFLTSVEMLLSDRERKKATSKKDPFR